MGEDRVREFMQQTTALHRCEAAPCAAVSGFACGGDGDPNVFCVAACEMRENLTVAWIKHRDRFARAAFDALVVDEVSGHGNLSWRSALEVTSRDNDSLSMIRVLGVNQESNRG